MDGRPAGGRAGREPRMHCKHATERWRMLSRGQTIIFQRSATCSGRFTYSLAKKSSAPPAAPIGYARAKALGFERKWLRDEQTQTGVAAEGLQEEVGGAGDGGGPPCH